MQCGAKMIMEKDAEAAPGAETRRISLVGTSACIEAGKALISAKVEEHRLRKLGQWVSEPPLLYLPLPPFSPRSQTHRALALDTVSTTACAEPTTSGADLCSDCANDDDDAWRLQSDDAAAIDDDGSDNDVSTTLCRIRATARCCCCCCCYESSNRPESSLRCTVGCVLRGAGTSADTARYECAINSSCCR